MPDLQVLLDQIDRLDRLDQQATRSPWGICQGDYYEVGPLEDDLGDVLVPYGIVEVADLPDAEFIALARTALPQLAQAVYHVLDLLDATERVGKHAYDFGGGKAPSLVSTSKVRKAITDALGVDGD